MLGLKWVHANKSGPNKLYLDVKESNARYQFKYLDPDWFGCGFEYVYFMNGLKLNISLRNGLVSSANKPINEPQLV